MWVGMFLVFVAVPLLELALLIKLGQWIGLWPTIVIILLTAGLGLAVIQQQGFAAFRRAATSLSGGTPPVESAVDGMMLMLAGGLLISPGILMDAAGLLLLIPPVRRALARWSLGRMRLHGTFTSATWTTRQSHPDGNRRPPDNGAGGAGGPVIEGEFERIDEKPKTSTSAPNAAKPYRNGRSQDT